jgi:hypothetical protein
MRRRSRACQIVDFINRQIERMHNVMANEAECVVAQQIAQVFDTPRGKIIDTDNEITFAQEPFAKMRTQEPCSASNENTTR